MDEQAEDGGAGAPAAFGKVARRRTENALARRQPYTAAGSSSTSFLHILNTRLVKWCGTPEPDVERFLGMPASQFDIFKPTVVASFRSEGRCGGRANQGVDR